MVDAPPFGQVQLGDLHRLQPISSDYGFDRGTPIDRYYIEGFLDRHRSEIFGRVLEVFDDSYSQRFGGSRVSHQDILDINSHNSKATLICDLGAPGSLPPSLFDCMIITQTLQYVHNVRLAVENIYNALKPGGTLLLTVPGITQVDKSLQWNFTTNSVRIMLRRYFGEAAINIEQFGNVFAATTFLHGIAVEEVNTKDLDFIDAAYPVTIACCAKRNS